jgi:hypothetical protein
MEQGHFLTIIFQPKLRCPAIKGENGDQRGELRYFFYQDG